MPPPTGFLALRLEPQAYGLLITVTVDADIRDRGRNRVLQLTRLSDAVALVTDFLLGWPATVGIDIAEEEKPGEPLR
jgi:hypothetical protein